MTPDTRRTRVITSGDDEMSQTIQGQVNNLKAQFRTLSASRRAAVRRDAWAFIARCPHMADASSFWRGLSARQVLAA